MSYDSAGSFNTHANYLRAIASEGGLQLPVGEGRALKALSSRIRSQPSMQDSSPANPNLIQARRSLSSAWGTELLLALSGQLIEEDEVIRLANNWAVVQTYYVVYHAVQALAAAKGFDRPESHSKTQNQFLSFFANRPLDLSPWSFAATNGGWCNLPPGQTIDPTIHPWTACRPGTQLSLIAKAFRTTRDDDVDEALRRLRARKQAANRRAWRAEEAERAGHGRRARKEPRFPLPRLAEAEKRQASSRIPASGLIQYLYRLRIKANYVDASMFTDGPSDQISSALVHRDLRFIASSSLLVHEMHVSRLVGPARLRGWADTWLASNVPSGSPTAGLAGRRMLL